MNDNIEEKLDNRKPLLRQFFGGAMAELILTDPI